LIHFSVPPVARFLITVVPAALHDPRAVEKRSGFGSEAGALGLAQPLMFKLARSG
jgi:hypothetical protein